MITAHDYFSGAGGCDLAARDLGWAVEGFEINEEARLTRAAAGLKTSEITDVREIETRPGEADAQLASPPCQSFSLTGSGVGRRALDAVLDVITSYRDGHPLTYARACAIIGDERAALVVEPLRLALQGRPTFIAWEQVPTVLPVWEACADVLRRNGYSVAVGMLNAEQHGVPQTRRRAILTARRDGVPASLPAPTHSRFHTRTPERLDVGVMPWMSMADALGWDPESYVISNYGTGGDPSNRGTRAAAVPSAPITSKADRMKVVLRNGNQEKACVRPIDTPAGTLFFGKRANWVAWQSETEIRKITAVEAAVLQSFPGTHPFQGGKSARMLQIGNAIPPGLARAILSTFEGRAT